jgi:8-oxo-dGTP pyrophosphatase MutT (NUDIX family)
MAASSTSPLPIRLASTVLLIKPNPTANRCNYDLLFSKRSGQSSFMANNYVFPGGILENSDSLAFPSLPCSNLIAEEKLSHRVCAIREVFEETGILLAQSADENHNSHHEVKLLQLRNQLNAPRTNKSADESESVFGSALHELGLFPAVNLVFPWARWLTPRQEKRRYNTWFYLHLLQNESNHTHSPDYKEITETVWLTPSEALNQAQQGLITLPPPTTYILHDLVANYPTVKAIEKYLQAQQFNQNYSIQPIEPNISDFGSAEMVIALPGDPLHSLNDNVGAAKASDSNNKDLYHRIVLDPAGKGSWKIIRPNQLQKSKL